jgi:uncharacterized membrane protein
MEQPAPHVRRSAADWETLVGGSWLNKLGVFILVIGIALALGYSFTRITPAGRVAASLGVSCAMLAAGVRFERSERYRTFARGLLGGGWAALYFTVYAMHAIAAARVIASPITAILLLLAVAAGMIGHSLTYRSETVTGLAYFIAFVTLAIAEITSLAVVALVPLAASLLYISHRFRWQRFAYLGLIATYGTIAFRGDTGAPLWQAQALFAIFWLIFEGFDILAADSVLLPFNALGFLGLSAVKWQHADPAGLWKLLAATAAAYVVSAVLRAHSRMWRPAISLAAVLAACATCLHAHGEFMAVALLIQAEVLYLAGVRLRAPFLRYLAACVFALELGRLMVLDFPDHKWLPAAIATAAAFYVNQLLSRRDVVYSYAASSLMLLILWYHGPHHDLGLFLMLSAAALFIAGWRAVLPDLRIQAYGMAALGIAAMTLPMENPRLSLAIAAGITYAMTFCPLPEEEATVLRWLASAATTGLLMAFLWRTVPAPYQELSWVALGLPLLELGLRKLPAELTRLSYLPAFLGAALVLGEPAPPHRILVAASLGVFAIAWRARAEERRIVLHVASSIGAGLMLVGWDRSAAPLAVVLLLAGLRWQSYSVAAIAFCRGATAPLAFDGALAAAGLYAMQLLEPRESRSRSILSLAATTLTGWLLYRHVSGSMLTVAWGAQGIALLVAGFPLRDRVLRLSGMGLLGVCILKLFVYDLRFLDTLPRILSFIVLGLILVAVSWIYTRFREHVERFL